MVTEKEDIEVKLAILEQVPTPIMAIDRDFNIVFMNLVGCRWLGKELKDIVGRKCFDLWQTPHCQTTECRIRQAMETDDVYMARTETLRDGEPVPVEYTAAPLKDRSGKMIGGLEYIVDITERVKFEGILRQQRQAILELYIPILKLWEGILGLPLIGTLDSARAQMVMECLLHKIADTGSTIAIIDITGVPGVDTLVVQHLLKTVSAARLMGAECIISGISPGIAQTIVRLGVEFGDVITKSTLADAFALALERRALTIT